MLIVECQEHLDKVKEFASKVGLMDQFQAKLDYLSDYANNNGRDITECHLYQDFAPHSFEFVMMRKDANNPNSTFERWFNGGLIYQGPDQPGDGSFPALTVSLDSSDGWHTHT